MIVQVRGTSGSGKTTVMRKVMDSLMWESVYKEKRKKPLFYRSADPQLENIFILGHYEESACGGCDTIGSAAAVYELIRSINNGVILCEGLLLSEDTKWTLHLAKTDKIPVECLFLTTPLERCLKQIKGRREAAGNTDKLDPSNTTNRVRTIERARTKLSEAGVSCRRVSPEQAPEVIMNLLRLHAQRGD